MKRNISLLILACEIAAIVILHAVKMNHQQSTDLSNSITVTDNSSTQAVSHHPLLSIK